MAILFQTLLSSSFSFLCSFLFCFFSFLRLFFLFFTILSILLSFLICCLLKYQNSEVRKSKINLILTQCINESFTQTLALSLFSFSLCRTISEFMFLVNAEQYVKDKNEYMYQFEYGIHCLRRYHCYSRIKDSLH